MTTSSRGSNPHTATETFEHALTTLILESFANGATIEGTWELATDSALVPNWRVVIEKTTPADLPSDGDTFLDE